MGLSGVWIGGTTHCPGTPCAINAPVATTVSSLCTFKLRDTGQSVSQIGMASRDRKGAGYRGETRTRSFGCDARSLAVAARQDTPPEPVAKCFRCRDLSGLPTFAKGRSRRAGSAFNAHKCIVKESGEVTRGHLGALAALSKNPWKIALSEGGQLAAFNPRWPTDDFPRGKFSTIARAGRRALSRSSGESTRVHRSGSKSRANAERSAHHRPRATTCRSPVRKPSAITPVAWMRTVTAPAVGVSHTVAPTAP